MQIGSHGCLADMAAFDPKRTFEDQLLQVTNGQPDHDAGLSLGYRKAGCIMGSAGMRPEHPVGYKSVRGSDVDRDGMYLEVSTLDDQSVLEIFYSDQTGKMSVTLYQEAVPLDVIEAFIPYAKWALTPVKR